MANWETSRQPSIEQVRAAGRIGRTLRVVGLGLLVSGRAHQDEITVGGVFDDDTFGFHPAGDGWGCFCRAEDWLIAGVLFLDVGVRVDRSQGPLFRPLPSRGPFARGLLSGGLVGRDVEPVTRRAVARGPAIGFTSWSFFLSAQTLTARRAQPGSDNCFEGEAPKLHR